MTMIDAIYSLIKAIKLYFLKYFTAALRVVVAVIVTSLVILCVVVAASLLTSCSLLKSNATRCFDLADKYGTVNLTFEENNRILFRCGE